MRDDLIREFTVAVFVVHEGRVLLLSHPKLARWLPPGGHVEPNELPDDAAVREVLEETGVRVRLAGGRGVPVDTPRQLVVPAGIQLEGIAPGHQHIDLVYFAVPEDGGHQIDETCAAEVGAAWFAYDDLEALGADHEIRLWCERALAEVSVPRVSSSGWADAARPLDESRGTEFRSVNEWPGSGRPAAR